LRQGYISIPSDLLPDRTLVPAWMVAAEIDASKTPGRSSLFTREISQEWPDRRALQEVTIQDITDACGSR
jgi:hypothetical protein